MAVYNYKARDKSGELIAGVIEGKDEKAVLAELDKLGHSVISIKIQAPEGSVKGALEQLKRINHQEVIIFNRQLATLLRTGMPLIPSLDTICEQTVNKKFRVVLESIQQAVKAGESFSVALGEHPSVFSELFVSMVEVGETGGVLDKVLDRLSSLGTQEMETSSRIKSALLYPIVLVGIAFLVVNFLIVGVLPKFVMVFKASEATLPIPTQIVLGLSWIARKLWIPISIGLVAFVFWFKHYTKAGEGRFIYHSFLLKIPIFGTLYRKIQVSRFSRTLAMLTTSGIPLLQALEVVEKTLDNAVIRRAIINIRKALTEGKPLVEPFKASGFFSPMVIQMISTGEKTGKLDQMLNEISAFYDPEIEYTIKNLTALLEPFMLLAMGLMVAFIALSVLLPIFNLIKVFRT